MTDDTLNFPKAPPVPPRNNNVIDTPIQKNTPEQEKAEGVFSEVRTCALSQINLPARDTKGRFLTGNNGGGRKSGSRNRFTEGFIQTIAEDFATNGAAALEALRSTNPEAYMRILVSLLPKNAIEKWEKSRDIDYENITHEEFAQLLNNLQREKMMRGVVESVSK
jgi:hypothetical protein